MLVLMGACKSGQESAAVDTNSAVKQETIDNRFKKVKVIDSRDVDGCGFLLMAADSALLDPGQLDEPFRKDQLEVLVYYKVEKDKMTICMRGVPVTIIEIKLLDK